MRHGPWRNSIPAVVILLLVSSGCGPKLQVPDLDDQANAKVSTIKRLADEMAKDADGPGARAAMEDLRNIFLDPQKHPKQATELVEVYRQRIQGKYRGSVAQEIQTEMVPFLAASKRSK